MWSPEAQACQACGFEEWPVSRHSSHVFNRQPYCSTEVEFQAYCVLGFCAKLHGIGQVHSSTRNGQQAEKYKQHGGFRTSAQVSKATFGGSKKVAKVNPVGTTVLDGLKV